MPDHDDRPEPDLTPVDGPAETEPAPPPAPVSWHRYQLQKAHVATSAINGKYCRVQDIGEGFKSVEIEGVEPIVTAEPFEICLMVAELSAFAGRQVRRFTSTDGVESYR